MKPRSSTETFASSSGQQLAVEENHARASSCKPQPAVYPRRGRRSPPAATGSSAISGYSPSGLPSKRDAQHADALVPCASGAISGCCDTSSALSFSASPFGTVTNRSLFDADLHRVRRALPHLERFHRLAAVVELHAVEELEAPVEQLERLLRARRFGGRAEQHREQAPLAAARGGDQAVARGLGVAGLDAVDARVDPQQAVAVGLGDVVVAEFLLRVVLRVLGRESRGSARRRSR